MSGYTETCLKAWGSHGNRDCLNAVNSGIDHRNIQCSALTLTSAGRSQRYETIHYKGDETFIVCMF